MYKIYTNNNTDFIHLIDILKTYKTLIRNYKTIKIKLLNRHIICAIINNAIKKVNITKT